MVLPEDYTWPISPGDPAPSPPDAAAVPEEGDATVYEIVVIAHDMIQVIFNTEMASNAALALVSSYDIDDSLGGGIPVVIKKVLVPSGTSTDRVSLVITDFTIGEKYMVTATGLSTKAGEDISVFNSAPFIGRKTKVDSMMESMPSIYNLNPESNLRGLFNAIGLSDDLIGGSRSDRLNGELTGADSFQEDAFQSGGFG